MQITVENRCCAGQNRHISSYFGHLRPWQAQVRPPIDRPLSVYGSKACISTETHAIRHILAVSMRRLFHWVGTSVQLSSSKSLGRCGVSNHAHPGTERSFSNGGDTAEYIFGVMDLLWRFYIWYQLLMMCLLHLHTQFNQKSDWEERVGGVGWLGRPAVAGHGDSIGREVCRPTYAEAGGELTVKIWMWRGYSTPECLPSITGTWTVVGRGGASGTKRMSSLRARDIKGPGTATSRIYFLVVYTATITRE